MYKEYHSVCPLVGNGTLPNPLPPASVSLPPEQGGGGAYAPAGEGWGNPNSDGRLEKSLALCLLCGRRAHKTKIRHTLSIVKEIPLLTVLLGLKFIIVRHLCI